jgi:hypothetical protein
MSITLACILVFLHPASCMLRYCPGFDMFSYELRGPALLLLISHTYTQLFDTLLTSRNLPRALAYELLGFAAVAIAYLRHRKRAWPYLAAWYSGHRALVLAWAHLPTPVRQPLPQRRMD